MMAGAAPRLAWLLLLVLVAGPLLAGCASAPKPPAAMTCEEEHDVPDDQTWLRILIARPLYSNELGLVRLRATPTAIGMILNETSDDGSALEPYAAELPADRKDWTLDESVWFEGFVPAGSYNFIRISIDEDITALRTDGVEPEVVVQFGRLTITHPDENQGIELPPGQCFTLLHEPIIQIETETRYIIKDKA